MAFTRLVAILNNFQSVPNKPRSPEYTSTSLKVLFDKAPNDIKDYVNDVFLDEIESTTDGSSGADSIGSGKLFTGDSSSTTVFGKLKFLYDSLASLELGEIVDGSLTNAKLNSDIKVGSLAFLLTTIKTSVVDAINEIFNIKVQTTTANITLYVNGTTGNDSNDGASVGTALKTITKAIELATNAKYIYHDVKIRVMAGDYSAEGALNVTGLVGNGTFVITAFDGTNDVSSNTLAVNYVISHIYFNSCKCRVYAYSLKGVVTSNNPFQSIETDAGYFYYCITDSTAPSNYGFYYSNSNGMVLGCIASNKSAALFTDLNSIVHSRDWGTCTGNDYGLYVSRSQVTKRGVQPQGTISEYRKDSGRIWGDALTGDVINGTFSTNWSGAIRWRINQDGQKQITFELGTTVQIATSGETVYTFQTELRPARNFKWTIGGTTNGGALIDDSLIYISIDTLGVLQVANIGSVKTLVRGLFATVTYY